MTTQTRIPQGSPWRQTPQGLRFLIVSLVVLAIVMATAGAFTSSAPAVTPVLPAAVQMRPVENQAQPVQAPVAVSAPAPAPQAPVPAASQDNGAAAPKPANWPLVRVDWQEVTPTPGVYLLNPIHGDGFYTGTMNRPHVTLEEAYTIQAYVKQHFPQLKVGAFLAVARDTTDKNIVLASTILSGGGSHLFLSVNGEKSWYELNVPSLGHFFAEPGHIQTTGPGAIRVSIESNTIHLIAQDNTIQEKWWETIINRTNLP